MFCYPYAPPLSTPAPIMWTKTHGTGSFYGLNKSQNWIAFIQPRVSFEIDAQHLSPWQETRPDVRTPAEHLKNIRDILAPSMGDLASVFHVSRQAVYKWCAGSSLPEPDKIAKLNALSKIADAFREANIVRADVLLKMQAFAGRSLLDLVKANENHTEHINTLIREAQEIEKSYQASGLAESKAEKTSDWQSSLSIPGGLE